MNRFPLWKYIVIGVTLVVAFLYTLPNFFGEVPGAAAAVGLYPAILRKRVTLQLLAEVLDHVIALGFAVHQNIKPQGFLFFDGILNFPLHRSEEHTSELQSPK